MSETNETRKMCGRVERRIASAIRSEMQGSTNPNNQSGVTLWGNAIPQWSQAPIEVQVLYRPIFLLSCRVQFFAPNCHYACHCEHVVRGNPCFPGLLHFVRNDELPLLAGEGRGEVSTIVGVRCCRKHVLINPNFTLAIYKQT